MPHICRTYAAHWNFTLIIPHHHFLISQNFQVHDGLKYNCEYCKKSFTRPDKLKQHLVAMHEGEKPVENVKEEPMEHDESSASIDNNKETDADGNLPKKFKCTHCEKCFTRAHHLRKN